MAAIDLSLYHPCLLMVSTVKLDLVSELKPQTHLDDLHMELKLSHTQVTCLYLFAKPEECQAHS